jgi:hypothetical protein
MTSLITCALSTPSGVHRFVRPPKAVDSAHVSKLVIEGLDRDYTAPAPGARHCQQNADESDMAGMMAYLTRVQGPVVPTG